MKILVSAFACDPDAGSEPGVGYNFAANLADAGHEVWCITRPLERANIEREAAKLSHNRLHFEYLWPPFFGPRLYRGTVEIYVYYMLWQWAAARRAIKLDRKIGFDLIHHISFGSLALGSGMWRVGKPLFFGPVGGGQMPPRGFEAYLGNWSKTEKLREFMIGVFRRFNPDHRQTMRRAKCVFVSNEETAIMARKSGAKNVIYLADPALPLSWAPSQPRTGAASDPIKLLWVGRLVPIKGPVFGIEALAYSKMPNWRLTIVGDGELAAETDAAIERLGLGSRITRLGKVDYARMREIYADHDMLYATSLRESVGIQLLEAMVSGLPVLTLKLHGAATFVPDGGGIKVDVSTPEATKQAVAAALDELCRNPETIPAMREVAQEAAQTYLWPNKIRRISQYYPQQIRDEIA